jgi:hypothetical protein
MLRFTTAGGRRFIRTTVLRQVCAGRTEGLVHCPDDSARKISRWLPHMYPEIGFSFVRVAPDQWKWMISDDRYLETLDLTPITGSTGPVTRLEKSPQIRRRRPGN